MSLTTSMSYDYNKGYFKTGMNGWHAQSYGIITTQIKKNWSGKKNVEILDMGCGDGFYGHYLRSFAKKLYGIDVSNEINSSNNKKFYDEVFQADLGKLFKPEAEYDLIFSSEVIEHVENYTAFIQNAYKLLKPRGEIFLTTTTYSCALPIYITNNITGIKIKEIKKFFKGWLGDYSYRTKFLKNIWGWTKGHYHGFSKAQLRKAFKQNGFIIERMEFIYAQPFIYDDFFRNPFRSVKYRVIIIPIAFCIRMLIAIVNFSVRVTHLYGSNVLVIAKKTQ